MLQFLASVLPAFALLYIFTKLDIFPEPNKNIFITFILGIFIVIPLLILGFSFELFVDIYFNESEYYEILFALNAPITEEILKLSIIVFYCSRLKEFDEPMDGLVYGATAALGFAMFENILYVYFTEDTYWQDIAVVRALLSVPSHSFDGVILGFAMSYYVFFNKKIIFPILGLLTTITLHFFWNYYAAFDSVLFLIIFFQILVTVFLFKDLRNRQKKFLLLKERLYD